MITPKKYLMAVVPTLLVLIAILREGMTIPLDGPVNIDQVVIVMDGAGGMGPGHPPTPEKCEGYEKCGDYYLKIIEEKMTYAEAKVACGEGYPAVIRSGDMNQEIKKKLGSSIPDPADGGYWIGYHFVGDNSWDGEDGTELNLLPWGNDIYDKYTNWAITNAAIPNDQWDGDNVNGTEHCAAAKGMHLQWYDENCDLKYMTICECDMHHN